MLELSWLSLTFKNFFPYLAPYKDGKALRNVEKEKGRAGRGGGRSQPVRGGQEEEGGDPSLSGASKAAIITQIISVYKSGIVLERSAVKLMNLVVFIKLF